MGSTRYSQHLLTCTVLVLPLLCANAACADSDVETAVQHKMDCQRYVAEGKANLVALRQGDPAIRGEWLDSVFYSAKQNSCLASVSFTKHGATYSSIFDISGSRAVWTRAYRGTSLTPAHIVAMDWDLYEKMEELEFAPAH